jgi:hypothetical protein
MSDVISGRDWREVPVLFPDDVRQMEWDDHLAWRKVNPEGRIEPFFDNDKEGQAIGIQWHLEGLDIELAETGQITQEEAWERRQRIRATIGELWTVREDKLSAMGAHDLM